jgi:acetyltransferase-like isoleucine patch superfamily enzyme
MSLDTPHHVDYRDLRPTPAAEKAFDHWIERLDQEFSRRDPEQRSLVVRDTLHEIFLGRPYEPLKASDSPAHLALVHSFDPRNATLEPEYYGDIDARKYAERKPLIWFWMMYDHSPLGLNHWLGFRVRHMIARHVLKHIGENVKIFHGVEISFGYNLTIEANTTIHKYTLLDDRGEIIVKEGSSVSDYANIYSHSHDLNDGFIVSNNKTQVGPKARITYHSVVLSGVNVGEHGIVGSMGVASKDVEPYHIVAGIPAKTVKIKSIAPDWARTGEEPPPSTSKNTVASE